LIRNGRSASLQRTFKKSFTSFSHSTRNKTRDGLIRVRNIRALNATGGGFLDRKSGSAGMPRPISYAVFCLKKKKKEEWCTLSSSTTTPISFIFNASPPPDIYTLSLHDALPI